MRRTALVTTALVLTLAACGSSGSGDSGGSSGSGSGATATTPATAVESATTGAGSVSSTPAGEADVTFAQGMIAHHEQAIEMAEMALDPKAGARAEVKDLATRIKAAQDPEIAQMKAWLTARGAALQMDTSDGHDMSSMDGMMSASDMDELGAKTGAEFDKAWLTMMIEHHEGAVTMSEEVKAAGTDAEMRTLADTIIAVQQKEIAEMKALGGA